MVEEVKQYSLGVVGISSTKHRDSNNVELDDGWKLFCSGIEPTKFESAGVVSPQLTNCVDEWIHETRLCMLRLNALERSVFDTVIRPKPKCIVPGIGGKN